MPFAVKQKGLIPTTVISKLLKTESFNEFLLTSRRCWLSKMSKGVICRGLTEFVLILFSLCYCYAYII